MSSTDRDKAQDVVIAAARACGHADSTTLDLMLKHELADRIATALSEVRRETWDAARQKHMLLIQSLPASAAGAGAFKASAIAALESAKEKDGIRSLPKVEG